MSDTKPKIYCFINGGSPGFYSVIALAEDGHFLAGHLSSEKGWAVYDIGIDSNRKHDKYQEHYPDGYELEWVDKPKKHDGLMAACQKNQELTKQTEAGGQ